MLTQCKKIAFTATIGFVLSACEIVEDTTVVFTPEAGVYAQVQVLEITLPPTASNVYLTTDTIDPESHPNCSYVGENITLDRATTVKLRFDVQGKTYNHERTYIIEENPQDSGLTNRTVIEAWEHFFVKQVLNKLPASNDEDSIRVLDDGDGGTVTINTRILDRSFFFDVPIEGSQTYSFNFFEKEDADTGELIMINSGAVYGYRNEYGGYYSTERREGQRIRFDGTYRGWADGDFWLDEEGNTSGGHYKVFCSTPGCAAVPVIYGLSSSNQFIEVSPVPNAYTRSCVETP